MFHLAMDLASCQPAATGTGGRLSPRPALRHRLSRGSLWGTGSGEDELQRPGPPWTCAPAPPLQRARSRRPPPAAPLPSGRPPRRPRSRRGRRHLRGRGFAPRDGRPTALPEVIVWGPTGEEDSLESSTLPSAFTTTATATAAATTATTAAATAVTAATPPRVPPSTAAPAPAGDVPRSSPGRTSTAEPAAGHSSGGKDARPPRGLGDSTGKGCRGAGTSGGLAGAGADPALPGTGVGVTLNKRSEENGGADYRFYPRRFPAACCVFPLQSPSTAHLP